MTRHSLNTNTKYSSVFLLIVNTKSLYTAKGTYMCYFNFIHYVSTCAKRWCNSWWLLNNNALYLYSFESWAREFNILHHANWEMFTFANKPIYNTFRDISINIKSICWRKWFFSIFFITFKLEIESELIILLNPSKSDDFVVKIHLQMHCLWSDPPQKILLQARKFKIRQVNINLVLSCALNQNMNPKREKNHRRHNFWNATKIVFIERRAAGVSSVHFALLFPIHSLRYRTGRFAVQNHFWLLWLLIFHVTHDQKKWNLWIHNAMGG